MSGSEPGYERAWGRCWRRALVLMGGGGRGGRVEEGLGARAGKASWPLRDLGFTSSPEGGRAAGATEGWGGGTAGGGGGGGEA